MDLIKEIGTLALATRMQKLGDSLRKEASQIYREHGIDFESKWFPVIYVLSKKSPISVVELANELGYAHPSVIALIEELQRKKLLKSERDKNDGRKRLLSLTSNALKMMEKMKPLWYKMQQVNDTIINNKHNLMKAIEQAEAQVARESFYDRMQKLLKQGTGVTIKEYDSAYHKKVVSHILEIDNNEFNLNLTLEDQPDLISIESSYLEGGGNFWIAVDERDDVVGTIALYNLGKGIGYLRKMFVKPQYRGSQAGISKLLLDILLQWAVNNRYKKIYLETTAAFVAARKFYRKHGFRPIDKRDLPKKIPIIKVAEFFFVYDLKDYMR